MAAAKARCAGLSVSMLCMLASDRIEFLYAVVERFEQSRTQKKGG
jgi:hypothetical protein